MANKVCPCCGINEKFTTDKGGRRLAAYCENCNRIIYNVKGKIRRGGIKEKMEHNRQEARICEYILDGFSPYEIAKHLTWRKENGNLR